MNFFLVVARSKKKSSSDSAYLVRALTYVRAAKMADKLFQKSSQFSDWIFKTWVNHRDGKIRLNEKVLCGPHPGKAHFSRDGCIWTRRQNGGVWVKYNKRTNRQKSL